MVMAGGFPEPIGSIRFLAGALPAGSGALLTQQAHLIIVLRDGRLLASQLQPKLMGQGIVTVFLRLLCLLLLSAGAGGGDVLDHVDHHHDQDDDQGYHKHRKSGGDQQTERTQLVKQKFPQGTEKFCHGLSYSITVPSGLNRGSFSR